VAGNQISWNQSNAVSLARERLEQTWWSDKLSFTNEGVAALLMSLWHESSDLYDQHTPSSETNSSASSKKGEPQTISVALGNQGFGLVPSCTLNS
jgi:hypothetical protein